MNPMSMMGPQSPMENFDVNSKQFHAKVREKLLNDIRKAVKAVMQLSMAGTIPDDSPYFKLLCWKLEAAFLYGVKDKFSLLGTTKPQQRVWRIVEQLGQTHQETGVLVGVTSKFCQEHPNYSHLSAWIRLAIIRHQLRDSLQCLLREQNLIKNYYRDYGLLASKDDAQLLLDQLLALAMVEIVPAKAHALARQRALMSGHPSGDVQKRPESTANSLDRRLSRQGMTPAGMTPMEVYNIVFLNEPERKVIFEAPNICGHVDAEGILYATQGTLSLFLEDGHKVLIWTPDSPTYQAMAYIGQKTHRPSNENAKTNGGTSDANSSLQPPPVRILNLPTRSFRIAVRHVAVLKYHRDYRSIHVHNNIQARYPIPPELVGGMGGSQLKLNSASRDSLRFLSSPAVGTPERKSSLTKTPTVAADAASSSTDPNQNSQNLKQISGGIQQENESSSYPNKATRRKTDVGLAGSTVEGNMRQALGARGGIKSPKRTSSMRERSPSPRPGVRKPSLKVGEEGGEERVGRREGEGGAQGGARRKSSADAGERQAAREQTTPKAPQQPSAPKQFERQPSVQSTASIPEEGRGVQTIDRQWEEEGGENVDRGFIQIIPREPSMGPFPVLHFHQGFFNDFLAVLAKYSGSGKKPEKPTAKVPEGTVHPDPNEEGDAISNTLFMHLNTIRQQATKAIGFGPKKSTADLSGSEIGEGSVPRPRVQAPTAFKHIFQKYRKDSLAMYEVYEKQELMYVDMHYERVFMDREGRIRNEKGMRESIFYHGIHPQVRKAVWKLLLGVFPFASSRDERNRMMEEQRQEYARLKACWTEAESEEAKDEFRADREAIEKDVVRTDRRMSFFEGEDNPNLAFMIDILNTFLVFNPEVGYVQGMSDLLAPVLAVMRDECESFWCFVGYMQLMKTVYMLDDLGMQTHILHLRQLMDIFDPDLHTFFEDQGVTQMFFSYRWFMLNFKREFDARDVYKLWEIIWANYLTPFFHIFVALAILLMYREPILNGNLSEYDILEFVSSLAMKMDIDEVIKSAKAYALYSMNSNEVPEALKKELFPSLHASSIKGVKSKSSVNSVGRHV